MKYVSQPALTKHLPDTAPGKENVTNCSKVPFFMLFASDSFAFQQSVGSKYQWNAVLRNLLCW